MIKQLTKEETKELEKTTTPLVNVFRTNIDVNEFYINDIHAGMAITCWYMLYDVDINKFGEKRDKFAEVIGFRPNYHVNYEYRNAVWGLEINGHRCVLYVSLQGTSLQVERDGWSTGDMEKFLKVLMDKIIDPKMLKKDTEEVEFFLSMCALP